MTFIHIPLRCSRHLITQDTETQPPATQQSLNNSNCRKGHIQYTNQRNHFIQIKVKKTSDGSSEISADSEDVRMKEGMTGCLFNKKINMFLANKEWRYDNTLLHIKTLFITLHTHSHSLHSQTSISIPKNASKKYTNPKETHYIINEMLRCVFSVRFDWTL